MTGKIIYAAGCTGTAEPSGCEDQTPPKTEQELMDASKNNAEDAIRRDVVPYFTTVMVRFKGTMDGIESPPVKDKRKLDVKAADNSCP